jgi:predicted nucleic acid-binding protein
MASIRSEDLYLSVLVVGEIQQGIERLRRRDPVQASVIETWLVTLLRDYSRRILPITTEVAETWGRMNTHQLLAHVAGLMVATAQVHGFTFVTRNTEDVASSGVRVLNPFRR